MMSETQHIPVMLTETLDALHPRDGGVYLDATLGGGGHTAALLEKSAPTGRVLSLDVDRGALARARERFATFGDRWVGAEENFRNVDRAAAEAGMIPVDGLLLDLGFSSDELADATKGLSFQTDGPLDMRLGPKANDDGLTAADIVNSWSEDDIANVIETFGEDRFARRIAHGIVTARKADRIIGTLDLVSVIRKSVPPSPPGSIHPATRTFQALRIAVNDEIQALKSAIHAASRILAPGGTLAIISFHSLEDRIVKHAFAAAPWNAITPKPLVPSDQEQQANPRSRSAKLRVATRQE